MPNQAPPGQSMYETFSFVTSKQVPHHFSKAGEFSRDSPAQQEPMAVIVQSEPAR
jgi:hypothetical protein